MAVREQEQAQPAERAAARRLGVLRQAALASTLLVGVLGGVAVWRAVDRLDAAEASGAVDERLLSRLESTLRELDREVTRPTSEAAQAAHDDARYTVVVVVVLSAGLGGAAAWLGRRLRPQEAPAGNEPTPHRT